MTQRFTSLRNRRLRSVEVPSTGIATAAIGAVATMNGSRAPSRVSTRSEAAPIQSGQRSATKRSPLTMAPMAKRELVSSFASSGANAFVLVAARESPKAGTPIKRYLRRSPLSLSSFMGADAGRAAFAARIEPDLPRQPLRTSERTMPIIVSVHAKRAT
jgi:hypothetical protein